MVARNIDEVLAELAARPGVAVRARLGGLTVEVRRLPDEPGARRLGSAVAALGPWDGESAEALAERLAEARRASPDAPPVEL